MINTFSFSRSHTDELVNQFLSVVSIWREKKTAKQSTSSNFRIRGWMDRIENTGRPPSFWALSQWCFAIFQFLFLFFFCKMNLSRWIRLHRNYNYVLRITPFFAGIFVGLHINFSSCINVWSEQIRVIDITSSILIY